MSKVLVVEDDEMIASMYSEAFTFDGHEATIATDGEEGLAKAKSVMPTIILLDVMLPKMNGFEMLEKLKQDEATKSIPVIMLTNLSGKRDAETALAKGAIKYIIKGDHDPKEIVDIVNDIIAAYSRDDVPNKSTKENKDDK